MKERGRTALCLLSATAFFVLLSLHAKASLMDHVCGGLFAGLAMALLLRGRCREKPSRSRRVPEAVLVALLCVPVLWSAVSRFAAAWSGSRMVAALSLRFLSNERAGILVLGVLMGVLALPFVFCGVYLALRFLLGGFGTIRYRELWRELTSGLNLRRMGKLVGETLLRLLGASLVGALLLTAVYALPVERMDLNVARSATIMDEEWAYPVLSPYFTSQLDNYTDSIILLEAACPAEVGGSLLNRAMTVPRGRVSGWNNVSEELAAHYLRGAPFTAYSGYARYWHGSLVFVKPLLLLTDYGGIRVLNGVVQLLVMTGLCLLLRKRGLGAYTLPTTLAYGMLMPLALAKSLQFSACFYVLTLGAAALLLTEKKRRKPAASVVFLYIGVATAYLDLLTYPIATFGVPALFLLLLCREEPEERRLAGLVKSGLSWCAGYGGMWVLKWVLGSLITGTNILADGADAFAKRASYTATENAARVEALSCLRMNTEAFLFTPVTFLTAGFLLWLLWRWAKRNDGAFAYRDRRDLIRTLFPFFLVSLAPVVWYLFAANHSTVHRFFTNKALVVSFLAILFGAETAVGTGCLQKETRKPQGNGKAADSAQP